MTEQSVYKKYEPLFGSWYITKKIGEGAIAQVYAMERKELGVTYRSALKAISIPGNEEEVRHAMADGMTGDDLTHYYETIVRNVIAELEFMSRLKGHTHIVSYEDHMIVEHEDGIGWDILIRIELLTPLIEYALEHPFREDDVLRLGIDICKALEYCRQFDILHRDVKPENIFVAPGGEFKLGDFGIARIAEETQMGLSRKGTYTYMAPEAYRGGNYGPTADIYSLGMVMYKYLNDGRNLYMPAYPKQIEADDYDTAFVRRISGAPMEEPAHGSRKLKRLVMRACAYDPQERPRSAAELRHELELIQSKGRRKRVTSTGGKTSSVGAGAETIAGPEQPAQGEGTVTEEPAAPAASAERKRPVGRIILVIVLALFLAAGVVDAIIPDKITAITGVKDKEEIYIGEQISPDYRIEPDWFADERISFHTADEDIASVDKKGRIAAHEVGETSLELSAKDYTREVLLAVVPKVTKIRGVKEKIRIEEGDTKKLKPELSPEKFADEPITYRSGNKKILTVSDKGKLTAKKPGKTKLTISAGGCTRKVEVEVYEYVPPEPAYSYNPGASGSSRSSGSSGSRHSSGGSGSSSSSSSSGGGSGSSGSGNSDGYFDKGDDEYF